nr:unnamed protein product [Callosobruchus chinensis]
MEKPKKSSALYMDGSQLVVRSCCSAERQLDIDLEDSPMFLLDRRF